MQRWLITWAVTDRHESISYVMEVYVGDYWEEAVRKKLEVHKDDRSYPGWALVNVQSISPPGNVPADELAKLLTD